MNRVLIPVLSVSLAISGASAFAGGPVVIEEEGQPEVVAEAPRSGWIVPVIIGGIILCAIVCGGDDDETTTGGGVIVAPIAPPETAPPAPPET